MVTGSIPTLCLSFLFSSQTAPIWLSYLFVNFNDTIQSKLNPSKKNGISKKHFFCHLRHITRDRIGGLWIKIRVSYQWAIVTERGHKQILTTWCGMKFRKLLNVSNSSKNKLHASLILVYPILLSIGSLTKEYIRRRASALRRSSGWAGGKAKHVLRHLTVCEFPTRQSELTQLYEKWKLCRHYHICSFQLLQLCNNSSTCCKGLQVSRGGSAWTGCCCSILLYLICDWACTIQVRTRWIEAWD